jgi:hypothetical protein
MKKQVHHMNLLTNFYIISPNFEDLSSHHHRSQSPDLILLIKKGENFPSSMKGFYSSMLWTMLYCGHYELKIAIVV